jgi:predicted transposase YbfD/YdcC
MDAMGTQKTLAQKIQAQGADYVLAVKGNQGKLHEALMKTFTRAEELKFSGMNYFTAEDDWNCSHGRVEKRYCTVLPLMYLYQFKAPWKGIQSVVRVVYESSIKNGMKKEKKQEIRYFISSLDPKDPKKILDSIKQHWQIEGVLHWSLDVTMKEDASRLRSETAAQNMAWLRKMAFALLKKETTVKKSIRRKQLKACMEPNYLLTVLIQSLQQEELATMRV